MSIHMSIHTSPYEPRFRFGEEWQLIAKYAHVYPTSEHLTACTYTAALYVSTVLMRTHLCTHARTPTQGHGPQPMVWP